jgi:hypothetical protein
LREGGGLVELVAELGGKESGGFVGSVYEGSESGFHEVKMKCIIL